MHTERFVWAGALAACVSAAAPAHADPEAQASPASAVIPAPEAPATSPRAPPPVAPPAPAPAPPVARGTVSLAAAGVALAGAATAVSFGILALQNKNDFEKNATYASADRGNNDAAYADGAIALAVCAGVTSLVLWLTRDAATGGPVASPQARPPANVSASFVVTSHGGGAGALLHF